MLEILIGDLSPVMFAGLMGASFVTALITVVFGLGGGVMLLGIMASILPPAALIPVHGVVQLGANAGRSLSMVRHVDRSILLPFGGGAVLGAALGGWLALEVPGPVLMIGIGLFVLWSVLATPPKWLARSGALAGAFSSFLTMFVGATGPFVATYVKALGLDRLGYSSTHGALMTLQHSLKLVLFLALGFAYGPWLGLMISMICSGFLGTLIGRSVLRKMSDQGFQRIFQAVLVVIGLRLIWIGLRDF